MTPSNTKLKVKLQAQAADDRAARGSASLLPILLSKPVHALAGTGFSLELCERHTERLARHGHPSIPRSLARC